MNCLHKPALDLANMFISFKIIRCTDCGQVWTRKEWNEYKAQKDIYDDTLVQYARGN